MIYLVVIWKMFRLLNLTLVSTKHDLLWPASCLLCCPSEVTTLLCSREDQHLLAINTAFNIHASVEVTA